MDRTAVAATASRIRRRPVPAADLPDLPPLLQRLYAARGVCNVQELDLGLGGLLDPGGLKGMDAATALLATAVEAGWRILVVGDFDADGATASAVAVSGLRRLGAQEVAYLIPDRVRHGYGLTPAIVAEAAALRPDLIITVDNGIASVDGVAAAKAAGMRVLVTDHHLPGQQLPDADAIVNPNQPGCGFASRCLAGVGVLFYVLLALRARLRAAGAFAGRDEPSLADELDLVAIGTVADVVPLDRNNRILVEQGLRRIRAGRARPGVYALARAAGRDPARLNAADIGFGLAPRLNAAGRLQDMGLGVACLLAADDNAARQAALRLEELNTERRELQAQMQADAMAAVAVVEKELAGELPAGLCVYRPSWHEGIVGLVAGRVREHYHRPTVAFAPSGDSGMLKGSARSLPGVHIRDVLERLATADPGLMTRFGGHASAAGLTLHADRLEDFTRAFGEELNSWVSAESLAGLIETDGALGGDELSLDNARLLRLSGPWGAGFPEPVFDGLFTVDEQRVVGSGHLKLRVRTIQGERLVEAIAFGRDRPIANDQPQRLVYRIDSNIYRGMESVQLVVSNVEPP